MFFFTNAAALTTTLHVVPDGAVRLSISLDNDTNEFIPGNTICGTLRVTVSVQRILVWSPVKLVWKLYPWPKLGLLLRACMNFSSCNSVASKATCAAIALNYNTLEVYITWWEITYPWANPPHILRKRSRSSDSCFNFGQLRCDHWHFCWLNAKLSPRLNKHTYKFAYLNFTTGTVISKTCVSCHHQKHRTFLKITSLSNLQPRTYRLFFWSIAGWSMFCPSEYEYGDFKTKHNA